MTRETGPAFEITFYHDEPEDANTDSRTIVRAGTDAAEAIALARAFLSPRWQTATVDTGALVEAGDWPMPSAFEAADPLHRWYIGPDWTEEETLS